jgi:hypothetical protein
MAKSKNTFTLKSHDDFKFVGKNGEYTIPPLEKLAYDQWKDVAKLSSNADIRAMLDAYKAFFLSVCPELEQEQIGDNQWLQFGTAYFESMGE